MHLRSTYFGTPCGPQLLEVLNKSDHSDLIRVYLDEGEIDRAIEAVQSERRPASPYGSPFSYGSGMRLEVAKAAEMTRPRAALEIDRRYAEGLIDVRGRENYKEACRHLKKVKDLYEKLGEPKEWAYYVGV